MSVQRARYAKIDRMVGDLLDGLGAQPVPVRIDEVVARHGIELRQGDLGDVSGLLLRQDDRTIIGVNSRQHRTRRRFTVAHEFGHFLLHHGIKEHFDRTYVVKFRSDLSSKATDVEEIEANYFAASLLMPAQELEKEQALLALDDDPAVERLAKRYDVSRHAMSLRLANVFRSHRPY